MTLTRRALGAALIGIGAGGVTHAQALAPPTDRPILTISGKIGVFNNGTQARFDRAMLEALGMSSFTTTTPWYDGPVHFEGVLMTRLMEAVKASGDTVIATALNDYETRIPRSDFAEFGVLLALKRNGEYMPVRDKGPLFIIYPYDSNPALKAQKFYSRSAWQLARLVVT
jgi:hypothetical protein